MQWEYATIMYDNESEEWVLTYPDRTEKILTGSTTQILNELGESGWELVGVGTIYIEDAEFYDHNLYFKRPKGK